MIYLDNNATTFPVPGLAELMAPYLTSQFGNPSSATYSLGKHAKNAIEKARISLAELIDADPEEIVFTSGGTEAIAMSFMGLCPFMKEGEVIFQSGVEHPAVRESIRFVTNLFSIDSIELENSKTDYFRLPVENETIARARIISAMSVNNETGVIHPVKEIAQFALENNLIFHMDGVQAVGKMPLSFKNSGADLMCLSGHKFGAPKGIGALVMKGGLSWISPSGGGGQEKGRRGGTESVPLIVALGEAARVAKLKLNEGESERLGTLRDRFEELLCNSTPKIEIIGKQLNRISNTSMILASGIVGSELVEALGEKELYISAGSACKTKSFAPSHVLSNMGYSPGECVSALRISFGSLNTLEEAEKAAFILSEEIKNNRSRKITELQSLY